MRKLGMIGGTSWHSTIVYYREINERFTELKGNGVNPELILYSLNIELMRSRDWDRIQKKYLDIAQKLTQSGAEGMIICANTPHGVFENLQPQIDIPILHIADATGAEAQKQGLQKIGLLGTLDVMEKPFIKDRIQNEYNIEVIIPDEDDRPEVFRRIAEELTRGIFLEDTRIFYLDQMNKMRERGAEGIILGCTELPMMFGPDDYDLPLLDTTRLHVNKAVDFILDE
jgi:aspartate racemase